jgi:hypothetical protein
MTRSLMMWTLQLTNAPMLLRRLCKGSMSRPEMLLLWSNRPQNNHLAPPVSNAVQAVLPSDLLGLSTPLSLREHFLTIPLGTTVSKKSVHRLLSQLQWNSKLGLTKVRSTSARIRRWQMAQGLSGSVIRPLHKTVATRTRDEKRLRLYVLLLLLDQVSDSCRLGTVPPGNGGSVGCDAEGHFQT